MSRAKPPVKRNRRIEWSTLSVLVVPALAVVGLGGPRPQGPPEQLSSGMHATSVNTPREDDAPLDTSRLEKRPRSTSRKVEAQRGALPDPIGPDERDYLEIRLLVEQRDIGLARDAALSFYAKYSDSAWSDRVHALTGRHRPPRPGSALPHERKF